jgi:hypothetical protein
MFTSVLRISLAMLILGVSSGCSLIFTKGPQPEMHPPTGCTSSVGAPVADTVLATASVVLLGLGVAAIADSSSSCTGEFCGIGNGAGQAVGVGAVIVGALSGILFTTSAVVGYQRTSACRASLEPDALLPRPTASLLPAPLVEACAQVDDAPRVCQAATLSNLGIPSPGASH